MMKYKGNLSVEEFEDEVINIRNMINFQGQLVVKN